MSGEIDLLIEALLEVERNCPCGARPESLNTHPHVLGCPVQRALSLARPTPHKSGILIPKHPPQDELDRLRQENQRLASDVDILRSAVKEFDNQCKSLESTIQRHKDCLEVARVALDCVIRDPSNTGHDSLVSASKALTTINQLLEKK